MTGDGEAPPQRRGRVVFVLTAAATAAVAGGTTWAGVHHHGATAPARVLTRLSPVPAGARNVAPGAAGRSSHPPPVTDAAPVVPPLTGTDHGVAPPGEPPLPAHSMPPTTAMTVRFEPGARWDGGVLGYFAITNTTTAPVHGWRLVVTVPSSLAVTASWEATMRRTGNTITFAPTTTTAEVGVGQTVRFGLQAATAGGFEGPQSCLINDASCA